MMFDDNFLTRTILWSITSLPVVFACLQVRVLESVDTGDDISTVYTDDILQMRSIDVAQRLLIVTNQLGEKLQLPFDMVGQFSPQLDTKWYSMEDLVEQKELPLRVRLVSVSQLQNTRGHNVFKILRVEDEVNVLATVNHEVVAIPLNVDIDVCLLKGEELESEVSSIVSYESHDRGASMSGIRRWGSYASFHDLGVHLGLTEEELQHMPPEFSQKVLDLYLNLQDKSAECIRLSEDLNRCKGRFDRLQNQIGVLQTTIMNMGRRVDFWCSKYESVAKIDNAVLKELDDYCDNPTLDMSDDENPKPRSGNHRRGGTWASKKRRQAAQKFWRSQSGSVQSGQETVSESPLGSRDTPTIPVKRAIPEYDTISISTVNTVLDF